MAPPVANTRSHWRINSLVVSRLEVSIPITDLQARPFFSVRRMRSQIFLLVGSPGGGDDGVSAFTADAFNDRGRLGVRGGARAW